MPRRRIYARTLGIFSAIYTFDFVKMFGDADPPGVQVEAIERQGVDGVLFKRHGARSEPFTLDCWSWHSSEFAMNSAFNRMKQLQGQFVDFYDEHNRLWTNFLVRRVIQNHRKKMVASSTGATYELYTRWTLQYPYGS